MWLYSPTTIDCPYIPFFSSIYDILVGYGNDQGLIAYRTGAQGWIISKKIGFDIKLSNGATLQPVYQDVEGSCYFTNGTYYLYSARSYTWVLMQNPAFPRVYSTGIFIC